MTMICPSSARLVLFTERLLVITSLVAMPAGAAASSELSCSTFRRRVSPSLMCGVTLRVMPMSRRSTVVKGLEAPALSVV